MSEVSRITTGIYRHYKGPRYLVLGLARHSETEELLVVYLPLEKKTGLEQQRLCVRPLLGPEGFLTPTTDGLVRFDLEVSVSFGEVPAVEVFGA